MRLERAVALTALALALSGQPHAAAGRPLRVVDPAHLDTTCVPCRDFFQYANGGWISRAQIPASYPAYGATEELADATEAALHELLQGMARSRDTSQTENQRKLGAYYGTCVDSLGAEALGMQPLRPQLDRIDALRSLDGLPALVAGLHRAGVDALFHLAAVQDPGNSDRYVADVSQGGLGLPERDYYLRQDRASKSLRAAYLLHVARVFELMSVANARARKAAATVMRIETALAWASMKAEDLRDPKAIYHLMKPARLQGFSRPFRWSEYLAGSGLDPLGEINVEQPAFFSTLAGLLGRVRLADWKTYLKWHAADASAGWLSNAWVKEDFNFRRRLSGAKALRPRWKRCMDETDGALGEALGQEYVQRYFSADAKAHAEEMVQNLKGAMGERIRAADWMSDTTRALAIAKLIAIRPKIGYPDKWRDYSRLAVDRGAYFHNRDRATAFENDRRLARIRKPVDRGEWGMTPPTVNAYYDGSMNEVVFPAGVLQPPFYDPAAPDPDNYGDTGFTIGHEITHGFDDEGRHFDARGNLRDWWTSGDSVRFEARAEKIVRQFNGYVAVDTLHTNGKLTAGENIADLGGLYVAWQAWQDSRKDRSGNALQDGFTPEQRFFVSYAQAWREVRRPESVRNTTLTDPHSQERWRVNGPLSNMQEFARAFGCKAGDPMVRPDSLRVQIW